MWSVGSEPAQVYLGVASIGVWVPGAASGETRWERATSPGDGWARALTLLVESLPKSRHRKVMVWLSGSLARPFLFNPVIGLRRRSEAIQIATRLAPEETGLAGPCAVWMDRWSPEQAAIVVAVDKRLRDDIERSAKEGSFVITSLQPWWGRAMNECWGESSRVLRLLALEEPDAITLLSGVDGRFDTVTSLVPKPEPGQIHALLTRALLAVDADVTQGLHAVLSSLPPRADPELPELHAKPFSPQWEPMV